MKELGNGAEGQPVLLMGAGTCLAGSGVRRGGCRSLRGDAAMCGMVLEGMRRVAGVGLFCGVPVAGLLFDCDGQFVVDAGPMWGEVGGLVAADPSIIGVVAGGGCRDQQLVVADPTEGEARFNPVFMPAVVYVVA